MSGIGRSNRPIVGTTSSTATTIHADIVYCGEDGMLCLACVLVRHLSSIMIICVSSANAPPSDRGRSY